MSVKQRAGVKVIRTFTEGKQSWIGLDNPGFRRKVFRTVDQKLVGSEFIVAGITIFPQGESSSLHEHPGSEEINVILSGSGEAVDADGSRQPFGQHDMIFVPKGRKHQHVNSGTEPLVLLWAYTPPGENPPR
ncbi:MAG: cupin domain-containing protein [Armatimonadetes bacterium]|nr:cupin domain-containing protein [Armatimonadota bacterium]